MTETTFIQILIVDDHTMVRRELKVLLEQFPGIKVAGEAANGLQAIEYVSRLQPDVVLMDPVMPVMDGIEAIQRILALHPDQRIIVLTASSDSETFVLAIKAGAQGYFAKDLDPDKLVQAIQEVYQGRNSTQDWSVKSYAEQKMMPYPIHCRASSRRKRWRSCACLPVP